MKKILFVLMSLIVIQYVIKNNEIKELKTELSQKQKSLDSLKSELFVSDIQLNRFQVTLDKMRENDSTCTLLFDAIMEMETE